MRAVSLLGRPVFFRQTATGRHAVVTARLAMSEIAGWSVSGVASDTGALAMAGVRANRPSPIAETASGGRSCVVEQLSFV